MKNKVSTVLFIASAIFLISSIWIRMRVRILREDNDFVEKVLWLKTPMPEYFRKVTGFDSIQLTWDDDANRLEANFCYYNKWEFEKFKHEKFVDSTVTVIDESTETIKYYKHQCELLWKAVDLLDLTKPENKAKLDKINQQIVSERQEHNQRVTQQFIEEVKHIISRK